MLANPYDPSRDLSPNLPTTSCRGQELTNVFGVGGHGQCCTFKSEFDDDCPDCCKVSPPAPMGVVVGDDYRGGPLALPCKLERDTVAAGGLAVVGMASSPVHHQHHHHHHHHHHSDHSEHHHDFHHDQPPSHRHHHHHAVVGYGSPEPSSSSSPPGIMSSYGAYGSSPPPPPTPAATDMLVRPKQEVSEVNLCDGCGQKILDRYYLFAVDKRWHATCLQCSQCARTLATEIKCFYRDGNIYCKTDYQR